MQRNGSPEAVFETDDKYSYFLAVLPVHASFVKDAHVKVIPENSTTEQIEIVTSLELMVLQYCRQPRKRSEIFEKIGYVNHASIYRRYILPLIEKELLAFTKPDKPNSQVQQYITTEKGRLITG